MPDSLIDTAATSVGWYGKLPAHGDFVTRDLPAGFVMPWDEWLQQSIVASRKQLGEDWTATYLESPIWRFALFPQVCGPQGWAGILMPSVDRAGRYFPLTMAAPILTNASVLLTVTSAELWFAQLERIALLALELDASLESIEAQLAQWQLLCVPSGDIAREDWTIAQRLAQWWAQPTGSFTMRMPAAHTLSAIAEFASVHLMESKATGRSVWWLRDEAGGTVSLRGWNGLPPADAHSALLRALIDAR